MGGREIWPGSTNQRTPVEWLASNVQIHCVYLVMKMYLCMYIYISIFSRQLFYSYNIIPATINHNNVYIHLQMIKQIVSLLFYTHAHRHYLIHDIFVRCQKILRRAHNNKRTFSDKKCALQARSCLTMVSVQSARFIEFNHSCRGFLCGSRYASTTSILASNITTKWCFRLLV